MVDFKRLSNVSIITEHLVIQKEWSLARAALSTPM